MVIRTKQFLAIGECMVELAPAEGGLLRQGFAGDTFNTAWYARRLLPEGWDVGYHTHVGDDAVSDAMLAFMKSAGLSTASIAKMADRTVGLYMISLSEGERSFSYWRGQSAARALADEPRILDKVFAGRGLLFFSGITLAILPLKGRQALCDALLRARRAGSIVAFDTNLRPRLWESEAAMRDGLMMAASVSDWVFPSFDEDGDLFKDAHPTATIARYREAGSTLVAVKNGVGEIAAWDQKSGKHRFAPAKVAHVADTTAAGDSFDAGVMAALLQGETLASALRQGAGLAARVIGAPGALVHDLFEGADT